MSAFSRPALLMRPFEAADWIGALIACPHCGRLLKAIKADGPYFGLDPSENYRSDRFWVLTLEDGETTRMWEDRKGVILNAPVES